MAPNNRPQNPPKLRHACNECHASKVRNIQILPGPFKVFISSRSGVAENAQDVADVYATNKHAPTVFPWWGKCKAIVGGHPPNKDAAITGADSRSGDQTLNIQTPMVPVATVQVIQDVAVGNHSGNDQNEASVEDSINVSRSPKQCDCNILPEGNHGKATVSSSPEDFSSRLSNMETYLDTPMIEHEFLWDFGSDEGQDVFNSVGLEKTSSVGTTNDSGYGDSELDFSIHEVPTTINSHHDFRSPKRQRTSPVPIPPIPEPHLFQKRPHFESSDKQPQQPQTDTPWMSQSQLYTRPTVSIRHHNSYSGEMHDYSENSASLDADSGFNRGFTSHPTTGQMNRNHTSMDHMSQNTRDDSLPFTARSQHLPFPMSPQSHHLKLLAGSRQNASQ